MALIEEAIRIAKLVKVPLAILLIGAMPEAEKKKVLANERATGTKLGNIERSGPRFRPAANSGALSTCM